MVERNGINGRLEKENYKITREDDPTRGKRLSTQFLNYNCCWQLIMKKIAMIIENLKIWNILSLSMLKCAYKFVDIVKYNGFGSFQYW